MGGGGGGRGCFHFLSGSLRSLLRAHWEEKNVTALPAINKAVAIFRDGAVLSPYFVRLLKGRLSNKLEN